MTKGVIAYLRRIRGIQETQRGWVPTHRKLRVDRDPFGAAWHGLQSVAGMLRTIDHNVRAGKKADRNFEGRVQSRSIEAAAMPKIHRTARRLGDEYLARLDRLMRSAETTSKQRFQRARLGVGAYFYQIPD
jgi:cytochrome oxidase assembly protein ShyY1